jgi:hypothetical protein
MESFIRQAFLIALQRLIVRVILDDVLDCIVRELRAVYYSK